MRGRGGNGYTVRITPGWPGQLMLMRVVQVSLGALRSVLIEAKSYGIKLIFPIAAEPTEHVSTH